MSVNTTTFNDATFVISGPGTGSGIFTMAAVTYNATSIGTNAIPLFQTYNIAAGSVTNLNGTLTAPQNIPGASFGNLTLANGGTFAKTALRHYQVKGSLTITNNITGHGWLYYKGICKRN